MGSRIGSSDLILNVFLCLIIAILLCIFWEAVNPVNYAILKNVNSLNFYGACSPPSNAAGYSALVLLCLLIVLLFLGIMGISLAAGGIIPIEYFDSKEMYAVVTGMGSICLALLANQFTNWDEMNKMLVFDFFGMLLFQVPHVILILQTILFSFSNSSNIQKNNQQDNSISVKSNSPNNSPAAESLLLTGTSALGTSALKRNPSNSGTTTSSTSADHFSNIECTHLKPGFFSRWRKNALFYDPSRHFLHLVGDDGIGIFFILSLDPEHHTRLVKLEKLSGSVMESTSSLENGSNKNATSMDAILLTFEVHGSQHHQVQIFLRAAMGGSIQSDLTTTAHSSKVAAPSTLSYEVWRAIFSPFLVKPLMGDNKRLRKRGSSKLKGKATLAGSAEAAENHQKQQHNIQSSVGFVESFHVNGSLVSRKINEEEIELQSHDDHAIPLPTRSLGMGLAVPTNGESSFSSEWKG